jgi:hypothetical protein
MYTLEDLYNRLQSGAQGAKRTGGFAEPQAGPGATGHNLNQLMNIAPMVDDGMGASPTDVAKDKTYWGLTTNDWGSQTGTAYCSTYLALVPKTGQHVCYKYDGTTGTIACPAEGQPGYGQDGFYQWGVKLDISTNRFSEWGSDVVQDNLTGLMWAQDGGIPARDWEDALSYCDTLNLGGHTDWRLPNVKELLTLIDYGNSNPALPTGYNGYFTNIAVASYWSSTTTIHATNQAWAVHFWAGETKMPAKTENHRVLPVRGGNAN